MLIEIVSLKLPIQDQVSNTLYCIQSMAFEIKTFVPNTDFDQLDLEICFSICYFRIAGKKRENLLLDMDVKFCQEENFDIIDRLKAKI